MAKGDSGNRGGISGNQQGAIGAAQGVMNNKINPRPPLMSNPTMGSSMGPSIGPSMMPKMGPSQLPTTGLPQGSFGQQAPNIVTRNIDMRSPMQGGGDLPGTQSLGPSNPQELINQILASSGSAQSPMNPMQVVPEQQQQIPISELPPWIGQMQQPGGSGGFDERAQVPWPSQDIIRQLQGIGPSNSDDVVRRMNKFGGMQ